MLTELEGSSMAVDSKQSNVLWTYGDVVTFLLRTYAMDDITAEAYSEVVNFL